MARSSYLDYRVDDGANIFILVFLAGVQDWGSQHRQFFADAENE